MHAVELIPVLEIYGNPSAGAAPTLYPKEQYAAHSLALAGFPEPLQPFAPGLPFYRAADLGAGNLQTLLTDHLAGYCSGKWALTETCTLFGGYVLRLEGQNALFPQCCGELSDIIYWKRLAQGQHAPNQGHPAPAVSFTPDAVILRCDTRDGDETFVPATAPEIRVSRTALAAAYQRVLPELAVFARNLEQTRQALNLPLGDLSNLLIFRNAEMPDEQP